MSKKEYERTAKVLVGAIFLAVDIYSADENFDAQKFVDSIKRKL